MKKLLIGMVSCLLLLSELGVCQEKYTVSGSRKFELDRIDIKSGSIITGARLSVTFWGQFDGIGEFILRDSTKTVEVAKLSYPLDRDDLRAQVTAYLNKANSNPTPFSEYSMDKVFMWLYSLNQDEYGPESGTLNLGRMVKVFEGNMSNTPDRIRQLESFMNKFEQRQTYYLSIKNGILENLDKINKTQDAFPDLKDQLKKSALKEKLDNLRNTLSSQLVPDWEKLNFEAFKKEIDSKLTDENLEKLNDTNKPAAKRIQQYATAIAEVEKILKEATDHFNEIQQAVQKEGYLPVEMISIQFERGNIERIQVWIKNERGSLDIFENIYAIGFTSINNYRAFQRIRLFLRKHPQVENKGIFLSDVLGNYDNLLDLYTRDYSPADTVINFLKPSSKPLVLQKAKYVNLFESRIYTDLQGINPDVPNGLVQVELSRRFNIHSVRHQSGSRTDVGYLSYFNLYGAITKIEDKERHLLLRNNNTIVNGQIVSPSYVSNLDLRRYENAVLGLDLNAFLFDYPDGKFTTYLDFGIRYGHTAMKEQLYTVTNGVAENSGEVVFPGHTITLLLPKINFEFFSERRVGFNLSYSFQHTYAFTSNRFKQVLSYDKSNLDNRVIDPAARKSHMAELNVRIETNKNGNGQLFFRNRFFWQHRDTNTFFVQSQLGYWYNIIFRK